MTEWPAVQQAVGVIPWIASLGFAPPARYWLWAAGFALDMILSLVRASRPERLLAAEQRERARESNSWMARLLGNQREAPVPTRAEADRPHLGERLGLFVIIVLGEAVAQLVNAAAGVPHWQPFLWLVVLLGFGLLVAMWWLTLRYGSSAAAVYGVRVFALRLTMPAHFLMTGSIVVIAAGLGALAGETAGDVPAATRWVFCAGTALYFLTATVVGLRGGASGRWIIGWGIPAVLAAVLLGLFGSALPAWALVAVVLVITGWHIAYSRIATPG
jgi:low temperature requirement protein LtrA